MISRCTCRIPGAPAAFQALLQHSMRTCSIPGAPAAFLAYLQHSRRTCSIPKEDDFPSLLYCDLRCSKTCRLCSQTCHQPSEACSRHSQVHPKFSLAHRDVPKPITTTLRVHVYQSSQMSVPPKAGRNALLLSDTLLTLMHLSLQSTSSQTLLEASRDSNTFC